MITQNHTDQTDILGEASKQEILHKCSENSRSQIVLRTDIFPKIVVGCPEFRELQRNKVHVNETSGLFLCLMAGLRWWSFPMLSDFFVEDVR